MARWPRSTATSSRSTSTKPAASGSSTASWSGPEQGPDSSGGDILFGGCPHRDDADHRFAPDQLAQAPQPGGEPFSPETLEILRKVERQLTLLNHQRDARQDPGHRRRENVGNPHQRSQNAGTVEDARRSDFADP